MSKPSTIRHDGLSIAVETFVPAANDLRYVGHGRLTRMGAIGLAEIARRRDLVDAGLARIAARKGAL